jgi:hypothetical protein
MLLPWARSAPIAGAKRLQWCYRMCVGWKVCAEEGDEELRHCGALTWRSAGRRPHAQAAGMVSLVAVMAAQNTSETTVLAIKDWATILPCNDDAPPRLPPAATTVGVPG